MLFPELMIQNDPRANVCQDLGQLDYWRKLLLDCASRGRISADTESDAYDPFHGGRIIGCSFGFDVGDGYGPRGVYFPIRHRTADRQLPVEPVMALCRELLGNPRHQVVFQNAAHDAPFFRTEGVEIEAYLDDTLIAGVLLDENSPHDLETMCVQYGVDPNAHEHKKVVKKIQDEEARIRRKKKNEVPGYAYIPVPVLGPYAAKDGYNGLALANRILPATYSRYPELYATELVVLRALIDMTWEGVLIDVPYLLDLHKRTQDRVEIATNKLRRMVGSTFNPSSDQQVQHLLYVHHRLPVYERTKNDNPAVNAFALKEIRRHHPEYSELLNELLELRDAQKILSTYTESMIDKADSRGRIHSKYQQNGAKTGRMSSKEPNLQNISADDEDTTDDHDSIRHAFLAPCFLDPNGDILEMFDFSQIEYRVMAFRAKEPTMIQAFINGEDIHLRNQIEVFGDHDKKSKRRRDVKVIGFGTAYGMTPKGIMQNLNEGANPEKGIPYVTEEYATEQYNKFHRRYPRIGEYTRELARAMARVRPVPSFDNMFGRTRRIEEIADYRDWMVQKGIRKAIASDIQGSAADVMKRSMARAYLLFKQRRKEGKYDAKMCNVIHDDLWTHVNREGAALCAVDKKMIMEDHPEFAPVPIVADGEWTQTRWDEKTDVWPKGK
jgi:DNA polymerase-1